MWLKIEGKWVRCADWAEEPWFVRIWWWVFWVAVLGAGIFMVVVYAMRGGGGE